MAEGGAAGGGGMSRLGARFAALQARNRCALIPYITAGDPRPAATVDLLHAMVAAGADVLELGVPFSDPMADGPVIQAACERALAHRVSLADVLEMVAEFRRADPDTPVVLMGYLNPIERMGYAAFAEAAAAVGADGVLTVDMPPEEAGELAGLLREKQLDPVFLLSPTSTDARITAAATQGSGFLYYVALKGVTGAGHVDVNEVAGRLSYIRGLSDLPIGVGFGVSDHATATILAAVADAVVIGSALIRVLQTHQNDFAAAKEKIAMLVDAMRGSLDEARQLVDGRERHNNADIKASP